MEKKTAVKAQHKKPVIGAPKTAATKKLSHRKSHPALMVAHKDFDEMKMIKKKKDEQLRLEELANSRQHIYMLAKKTHFTTDQVDALVKIYRRLVSLGKMDRLRFRETLYCTFAISDDIMLDRIFGAFDGDSQGSVSETEWVIGMSAFLKGSLDEQIAYCYEVYDMNGDRGIVREEVYHFLQNCISPLPGKGMAGIEPDEVAECCRDIAELAMKKLDVDRNGVITYVDFHEAVNKDPLLLEALGPCLGESKRIKLFMTIFADDYWTYATNLSHPKDLAWDRERNKFARRHHHGMRRSADLVRGGPLLTHKERKVIGVEQNSADNLATTKQQNARGPVMVQNKKGKANMNLKPSMISAGGVSSKSTMKTRI